MPTRFKKSRKLRGHVSSGHGRVGKHRKHPGGRGYAGAEHHHRINIFKYHPGYIGKHGFRRFHLVKNHRVHPTVNVRELWALLSEEEQAKYSAPGAPKPVIDITRIGLHIVRGGEPISRAMIVRARRFTKKAAEMIVAAGGEAQIIGAQE